MSFDTPSFCSSFPGSSPVPLRILYQDDDLVAIHKPAGHVVHRTKMCPSAPVVLGQLRDQLGRFLYTNKILWILNLQIYLTRWAGR